jgi:AraC-like DNA-binding protein
VGPESVLVASEGSPWAGFPLAYVRSPPSGSELGTSFDSYWLAFVVRGGCSATLRVGTRDKNLEFSSGYFAGYPPGSHWDWMGHRGTVEAIVVSLDWRNIGDEISMPEDLRPCLSSIHACERDVVLGEIARTMLTEIRAGCPTGRIFAESLSIALGARLASVSGGSGRHRGRYFRLSMGKAASLTELIDATLDGDLTVSRLAQEVGLSSSHFAGCFVQTFGCSVHQYVLSRRVRRAVELLDKRSAPACEIALQCGFASQSHFSSVFKKMIGRSPSQYSKEH